MKYEQVLVAWKNYTTNNTFTNIEVYVGIPSD